MCALYREVLPTTAEVVQLQEIILSLLYCLFSVSIFTRKRSPPTSLALPEDKVKYSEKEDGEGA